MGSIAIIDLGQIAQRLGLRAAGVEAVVHLLDEGNTGPFITRYRRDQTGAEPPRLYPSNASLGFRAAAVSSSRRRGA
jgi:hypothetical protein